MTEILSCGHAPSESNSLAAGYAQDKSGRRICYDCAAQIEQQGMIENKRATLYLTRDNDGYLWITNWSGRLKIKVRYAKKGRHNMARVRFDAWFVFNGYWWHGTSYGLNTELIHCKQTKDPGPAEYGGCRVSDKWLISYK